MTQFIFHVRARLSSKVHGTEVAYNNVIFNYSGSWFKDKRFKVKVRK